MKDWLLAIWKTLHLVTDLGLVHKLVLVSREPLKWKPGFKHERLVYWKYERLSNILLTWASYTNLYLLTLGRRYKTWSRDMKDWIQRCKITIVNEDAEENEQRKQWYINKSTQLSSYSSQPPLPLSPSHFCIAAWWDVKGDENNNWTTKTMMYFKEIVVTKTISKSLYQLITNTLNNLSISTTSTSIPFPLPHCCLTRCKKRRGQQLNNGTMMHFDPGFLTTTEAFICLFSGREFQLFTKLDTSPIFGF